MRSPKLNYFLPCFFAEHSLPFIVADHFTMLCTYMFSDSNIARKFACKRTKTTNILNNALAPHHDAEVTQLCKTQKFSIMIDESTDQGDNKSMAVLVRVYDQTIHRVTTKFLGIPNCNIATGENLFNNLNQIFIDREIPWTNCIAYSSDNANVMIGQDNSVLSRVRQANPNVYDLGCVCHLANLCTKDGIKALSLPVEELLIDVYFHFNHSTKRKEIYKQYQQFTDTDALKILKHCSTRWLSLQDCITRFLQQWPALQSYFASHSDNEKPGCVQRCNTYLHNKEMHLYYLFLDYILPVLNEFNITFQSSTSMIGHLHSEIYRLLRKFLGKFVLTKVISTYTDITEVDYITLENQHPDNNIAVGMDARQYLQDNQDDITQDTTTKFFTHVRKFYQAVVTKILEIFPFHDPTLRSLAFLNPDTRVKVTSDDIIALSRRFTPELSITDVDNEAVEYLVTPRAELPAADTDAPLDNFWTNMAEKKLPSGNLQYQNISKVAIACLSVAHSNADPERTFSLLNNIQTDKRSSLCNKTIHSLLSVKINSTCTCYDFKPTKDLLRASKSACSV